MNLLQTTVGEVITPHLADQMFTVVLLVAFAIWMIKRQREDKKEEQLEREKLEVKIEQVTAKHDKYMEDDRQMMLDVVDRNTRVMERIELHIEKQDK